MDDSMKSILNYVKKMNGGIPPEDNSFDADIIAYINTTFMELNMIGVGPKEGYFIEDATPMWTDYVSDRFIVESIKSYVAIKVKLVFDTPTNAAVIDALTKTADKYEYKIRDWVEEKESII